MNLSAFHERRKRKGNGDEAVAVVVIGKWLYRYPVDTGTTLV